MRDSVVDGLDNVVVEESLIGIIVLDAVALVELDALNAVGLVGGNSVFWVVVVDFIRAGRVVDIPVLVGNDVEIVFGVDKVVVGKGLVVGVDVFEVVVDSEGGMGDDEGPSGITGTAFVEDCVVEFVLLGLVGGDGVEDVGNIVGMIGFGVGVVDVVMDVVGLVEGFNVVVVVVVVVLIVVVVVVTGTVVGFGVIGDAVVVVEDTLVVVNSVGRSENI